MAEMMEFSLEMLQKMSKSNLETLAQSLHITIAGLSKAEIIDKIVGTGQVKEVKPETAVSAKPTIDVSAKSTADVSETKAAKATETKADKTLIDVSETSISDHDVSYEDTKTTKLDLKLRLELMRVNIRKRELGTQRKERERERNFERERERDRERDERNRERDFELVRMQHELKMAELKNDQTPIVCSS